MMRTRLVTALALATVALCGCGGGNNDSPVTPLTPAPVPGIAVAIGSSLTVVRGASGVATFTVTRAGGYTGAISLAATGVPLGATVTFDPSTLTGSVSTSNIIVTVTSAAVAATSPITVVAAGTGVQSKSAQFSLIVTVPSAVTLTALGLGAVPDRYTAEVWVRNTTAYTTTWGTRGGTGRGNAIKIWDVSANAPALIDSVIVANASTLGDVQVSDDGSLLVAAIESNPNGGLAVYQLDTPRSARLLVRTTGGELQFGVHTAEIARVNGVLYAFCAIDPTNGVPARLVIVSLANPSQPVTVSSLQMGSPYIHDVFVRDGLLFTGEWNDGIGIWDIGGGGTGGTVANPKRVARLATIGGKVHNVWWYHDPVANSKRYLFVGEEGPGVIGSSSIGDIHVVDISTIAAPAEVARFNVAGGGTHNFSVDEANGFLYAAYYNAGVRVLDVRGDLGSCTATQKTTDGRCDLTLMGRAKATFSGSGPVYVWGVQWTPIGLFASDMLNGLWRIPPVSR